MGLGGNCIAFIRSMSMGHCHFLVADDRWLLGQITGVLESEYICSCGVGGGWENACYAAHKNTRLARFPYSWRSWQTNIRCSHKCNNTYKQWSRGVYSYTFPAWQKTSLLFGHNQNKHFCSTVYRQGRQHARQTSSDFFLPRAFSRYFQKNVRAHLLAVVDSFASWPSELSGP